MSYNLVGRIARRVYLAIRSRKSSLIRAISQAAPQRGRENADQECEKQTQRVGCKSLWSKSLTPGIGPLASPIKASSLGGRRGDCPGRNRGSLCRASFEWPECLTRLGMIRGVRRDTG